MKSTIPPSPASTHGADRLVEVCAVCLTASCWHGEFLCEEWRTAGTLELSARELDKRGAEHPDNYSQQKIEEVGALSGR